MNGDLPHKAVWPWALLFALCIMATQFGGLGVEVWNGDETTFMLIARSVLDGHLPYTELFDNKPPGIFLVLAGAMALLGESLFVTRLLGDAALLVSTLFVFLIARRWVDPVSAGAGAVLNIALHATPIGQYTSTEMVSMAFIMGAAWCLVTGRGRLWPLFLAGLLISIATLIRSNLGLQAVVVGVYLVMASFLSAHRAVPWWAVVPYTLGGLVPVAILSAVYLRADAFFELRLSAVDVALHYAESQNELSDTIRLHVAGWWQWIKWDPEIFGIYTAFLVVGAVVFVRSMRASSERADKVLILTLLLGAVLSVLLTGPAYYQYWLQIVPFLSILCALALATSARGRLVRWGALALVGLSMLGAMRTTVPPLLKIAAGPAYLERTQILRAAAAQIECRMQPGDQIWAADNHLVLWYLDELPMHRVITHPSNISRTHVIEPLVAQGYAQPDLEGWIYTQNPDFIVVRRPDDPMYLADEARFYDYLDTHYTDVFQAPNPVMELMYVTVYQRRAEDGSVLTPPRACPAALDRS